MNFSILGCGSIGSRHVQTLLKLKGKYNINQIKIYDENKTRSISLSKQSKIIYPTNSLKECLVNTDITYICFPTNLHVETINNVIDLGVKNIFVEKPFSHKLNGCEEIVHKVQKLNVKLYVGYMLRFHPVIEELKNILDKKIIGKVINVRAESGFYLPFWHPWEDYREFYMSSKFGGGGVLLDTSHEFDYLYYLFGNIKSCQGIYSIISDLEIRSDDYSSSIIEFENNIIAEVHLDLLQPKESRYCKIIGTKGVIIADLKNQNIAVSTLKNPSWKKKNIKVNFDKIYLAEISTLLDSVLGKKNKQITNLSNIYDSLHIMEVIEAIRLSSSTGSRIRLPIYD